VELLSAGLLFFALGPGGHGGRQSHDRGSDQESYEQGPEFLSHKFLLGNRLAVLLPIRYRMQGNWIHGSTSLGGDSIIHESIARNDECLRRNTA
jgi:hypothetical protein